MPRLKASAYLALCQARVMNRECAPGQLKPTKGEVALNTDTSDKSLKEELKIYRNICFQASHERFKMQTCPACQNISHATLWIRYQ